MDVSNMNVTKLAVLFEVKSHYMQTLNRQFTSIFLQ